MKRIRAATFGDVITGGAVRTSEFRAHPVCTGGTDAWSFVIAKLRGSLPLINNCPQVSEIKHLNRREKLAINMVMGMNMFIKLKCKKERRLEHKG